MFVHYSNLSVYSILTQPSSALSHAFCFYLWKVQKIKIKRNHKKCNNFVIIIISIISIVVFCPALLRTPLLWVSLCWPKQRWANIENKSFVLMLFIHTHAIFCCSQLNWNLVIHFTLNISFIHSLNMHVLCTNNELIENPQIHN